MSIYGKMINRNKLIEAKRDLYHLFLQMKTEEMTNDDVDIAYLLSRDKDIQQLLDKKEMISK